MSDPKIYVVECPAEVSTVALHEPLKTFLAGGITGCPDWQTHIVSLIRARETELQHHHILLNPRRAEFDINDATISTKQIEWEHAYLNDASSILFWFPSETLCPITLFELGAHLYKTSDIPIFIGCHPDYARRHDVIVQARLVRPSVCVVDSLDALVEQFVTWSKSATAPPQSF